MDVITNTDPKPNLEKKSIYSIGNILKFAGFSIFGVLLFFTPITINGVNSIPLDHLITFIRSLHPLVGPVITVGIVTAGGIIPWIDKTYKKDTISFVISVFRLLAIPLIYMALFKIGPEWLMKPDMLPFIFDKVVIPVALIVPIGSIFLTFIICFGLLEFIGVIVRPFMRPIFKVPGKAAIDAVASFVGSFSVAIFLTNRLYNESKYTNREAVIIMSGFSTVSATFMIIVAKTGGMMEKWNFFFWTTLIITFVVSALTVRLWPITKIDNSYVDGVGKPEVKIPGNILVNAVKEGLETSANSGNLLGTLWSNFSSGMKMIFILAPCGTSIGVLSYVLVKMTPVFDVVSIIFIPFTFILGIPEFKLVAKACAMVLGEMFVPNLLVAKLPMMAKYVVGVTSISAILFFSGSIPCILATNVKFKTSHMILIWFERTVLTIIIASIVGMIFLR